MNAKTVAAVDDDLSSVVCLAGPTASGKSAAALAIAERLSRRIAVEIVSVDSALVYRDMTIGTAKPSAAERATVPHHLVDIIDAAERYSAARFVAEARREIAAIHGRGALPLLVGGTMLYFKALFDGLDALPGADAAIRAALDAEAGEHGWPSLHAELQRVDPASAARLSPLDSQRIQRALEVYRISGKPLSEWHTGTCAGLQPPLIALEPADRSWLHGRIEARFAAMLDAGLVDEVRGLRARGDLDAEMPSMRAVGYRQAWQALESGDLSRLSVTATAATRQLAKRQLTWLRSMPWRQVVACDTVDATAQVVRLAEAHVDRMAGFADGIAASPSLALP
ncbi:MAG: tRNA (adenosine(37)-N6)-dimethylallyltransferase MiaA [Caldimonas sp.]